MMKGVKFIMKKYSEYELQAWGTSELIEYILELQARAKS